MGGQTSRMVREAVSDSLFIMRQTNRSVYQESVASRQEVEGKIRELRQVRRQMLESVEQDATRSEMFKQFQGMNEQKKAMDKQVEGFAKQFELPKSYQTIADAHEEEARKQAEDQEDVSTKKQSS